MHTGVPASAASTSGVRAGASLRRGFARCGCVGRRDPRPGSGGCCWELPRLSQAAPSSQAVINLLQVKLSAGEVLFPFRYLVLLAWHCQMFQLELPAFPDPLLHISSTSFRLGSGGGEVERISSAIPNFLDSLSFVGNVAATGHAASGHHGRRSLGLGARHIPKSGPGCGCPRQTTRLGRPVEKLRHRLGAKGMGMEEGKSSLRTRRPARTCCHRRPEHVVAQVTAGTGGKGVRAGAEPAVGGLPSSSACAEPSGGWRRGDIWKPSSRTRLFLWSQVALSWQRGGTAPGQRRGGNAQHLAGLVLKPGFPDSCLGGERRAPAETQMDGKQELDQTMSEE
ncbi:uncharacterized protein LOC134150745 [Rhea pennata]|uniref:uncharacterized protein LOC134150745 n=1 Tax=Rhea pennata TaxID=8795 RepID=UPI002E255F52